MRPVAVNGVDAPYRTEGALQIVSHMHGDIAYQTALIALLDKPGSAGRPALVRTVGRRPQTADMHRFADSSGCDPFGNLNVERNKAQRLVNLQHQPLAQRQRNHLVGLGQTAGHRLLHQDMFAGLQCLHRLWKVVDVGGGDHDGIEIVRQQLGIRLADRCLGQLMRLGKGGSLSLGGIEESHNLSFARPQLPDLRDMVGSSDLAAPDESETYLAHTCLSFNKR